MNPDRKQRFIEAFSDALVAGIERCSEPRKLILGVDDVPAAVKWKLTVITKKPGKFDIDNECIQEACRALEIPCTREDIVKFLEGDEVPRVEQPVDVEALITDRMTVLTTGAFTFEGVCEQMTKEFPGYKFSNVQDEFIIEKVA